VTQETNAALHDSYAADYDSQVQAYDCYIAEVLFGLCYEFVQPGQSLLDLGIGSGLSALLFTKAGLNVSGMDFSAAMLEICRSKGITAGLKQHDIQQTPWPFSSDGFDHLVCCGVLHFIRNLESIFGEAGRVLRAGGLFAFTTKVAPSTLSHDSKYDKQIVGDFEILSHSSEHVKSLLEQYSFENLKTQKYFVGDDIFNLWVVQKQ